MDIDVDPKSSECNRAEPASKACLKDAIHYQFMENVSEKGHRRSTVRDQKPLISSRSRSIEG